MTLPHVDVVKAATGFLALVHAAEAAGVGPRVLQGEGLDQLARRLVSTLISEYGASPEAAAAHIVDSSMVRNVESTIMAAFAKGKGDA